MCGICGKVYADPSQQVRTEEIEGMAKTLAHRGPDAQGVYVRKQAGLGHRRLSIIDLEGGAQPMPNARGDFWLVFNGEIYNFPALRASLEKEGYRFRTHSDTEVLLACYERYGLSCVDRLRGMFAFAIWDVRAQRLFLARDRVGQKPLFYRLKNGALSFASEIKALLQEDSSTPPIDRIALSNYLSFQYIPAPATIFQGITQLPPAHTLVYEQGQCRIERYWDLEYRPKLLMDERELEEEMLRLLKEAVSMRMLSDVPLGAFLSGGIDSGLIVALMSELSDRPVKTFSIGFHGDENNELPYANMVAERYGTEHYEIPVTPHALETLPLLIKHFDEPFGDPSALPTWYVARESRKCVTVALNGDGGDESFAGYRRYVGYTFVQHYRRLPHFVRKQLIAPFLRLFPEDVVEGRYGALGLIRRLKYLTPLSFENDAERYARSMSVFGNPLKHELLGDEIRKACAGLHSQDYLYRFFEAGNAEEEIDRMLYTDIMSYLPSALLVKIDRMTMAHGLEGRSPFLDHHVMEFAATLPVRLKKRGNTLKFFLKDLARQYLPEEIVSRPKQGFRPPIGDWFQGELAGVLEESFTTSRLARDGVLNAEVMQRLLQEHRSAFANHQHRLWMLLNLELWYRSFVKNEPI